VTAAAVFVAGFTAAAVTLLAIGVHRRNRARYVPAPKPAYRKHEFGPVRVINPGRVFDWETDA